jgi:hypothetical protein
MSLTVSIDGMRGVGLEGLVGRHLQAVHRGTQRLALRAHQPVVVAPGGFGVARALDQRDAADLVARALARRRPSPPGTSCGFQPSKVNMKLTPMATSPLATFGACALPLRVYCDGVAVQLLEVVEGGFLAHHLHQAGQDGVGRAAGGRVRDLDLALVLRLDQVGPAGRRRQVLLLGQQFGIEAEADGARNRSRRPCCCSSRTGARSRPAGRSGRPGDRLPAGRRWQPANTGRRCRPTTGPSSGCRLRLHQLGHRFARGLARLLHLDASGLAEFACGGLAPGLVGAAQRVDGLGPGPVRRRWWPAPPATGRAGSCWK